MDCRPERVLPKEGAVVAKVTARPADVACIAGELARAAEDTGRTRDGEVLLRLETEGEFLGPLPGELTEAVADGDCEPCRLPPPVIDGELRMPAGDPTLLRAGDLRTTGDPTRLGRQCLMVSEPD